VLYSFLLFLLYSFQRAFKLGHIVYQEAYENTRGWGKRHLPIWGKTALLCIKANMNALWGRIQNRGVII
jgi:hypothetical protein